MCTEHRRAASVHFQDDGRTTTVVHPSDHYGSAASDHGRRLSATGYHAALEFSPPRGTLSKRPTSSSHASPNLKHSRSSVPKHSQPENTRRHFLDVVDERKHEVQPHATTAPVALPPPTGNFSSHTSPHLEHSQTLVPEKTRKNSWDDPDERKHKVQSQATTAAVALPPPTGHFGTWSPGPTAPVVPPPPTGNFSSHASPHLEHSRSAVPGNTRTRLSSDIPDERKHEVQPHAKTAVVAPFPPTGPFGSHASPHLEHSRSPVPGNTPRRHSSAVPDEKKHEAQPHATTATVAPPTPTGPFGSHASAHLEHSRSTVPGNTQRMPSSDVLDDGKHEAQPNAATVPAPPPPTMAARKPIYLSNLGVVVMLIVVFTITLVLAIFTVSAVRKQEYLQQQEKPPTTQRTPFPLPRATVFMDGNSSDTTTRPSEVTSVDVSDTDATSGIITLNYEVPDDGEDTRAKE
ncbi:hypothetical protein MRX96_032913 [Rhipicephalus microplus]